MGFTVEPTVLESGSACFSQFEIVFEQTRKSRGGRSLGSSPRRFLISRIRKRWEGV